MELLETQPLPLSRAQAFLLRITVAAVALTRLLAASQTVWDWDEAQFAMGVEEYDAAGHRPHPPGFPLFVALAKLVRPLAASDFHALQAVTVTAAMALFPILFVLCRELRFPFATAYSGALLSVFLPNVWFFGGTAFSDIPSLALTAAACALLLRGVRDRRAIFIGALLLGLAASIRPQALLIGCAPGLVLLWKRRREWRLLAAAIVAGAAVIAVSYSGAALASQSVEAYLEAGQGLRDYLRQVDSFLSPDRPPLSVLFEFFFLRAIPGEVYARIVIAAAVAGSMITAIRREGRVWLLVAMFLPFQIFAWLMLDYHSVARYGVSFAPMYAILAAAGVVGAAAWIPGVGRAGGVIVVLALTALLARWSMPVLSEVRRNPSPPVRAMRWIEGKLPPSTTVYVHGSAVPFTRYFLKDRSGVVEIPVEPHPLPDVRNAVVVTETPTPSIRAERFVRGRGRIMDTVRQRYFEVTILPASAWAEFADGWHGQEWHGESVWIWMGQHSVTHFSPLHGPAELKLRLEPVLEKGPPVVELRVNGELIERFVVEEPTERRWVVPARNDGWNTVELTTDRAVNPARDGYGQDTRDLSLRLLGHDWAPASR